MAVGKFTWRVKGRQPGLFWEQFLIFIVKNLAYLGILQFSLYFPSTEWSTILFIYSWMLLEKRNWHFLFFSYFLPIFLNFFLFFLFSSYFLLFRFPISYFLFLFFLQNSRDTMIWPYLNWPTRNIFSTFWTNSRWKRKNTRA